MKSIILTLFATISLTSCAQESVKGNGNFTTENRNVDANFDEVESAGSFDVVILDGLQDGKIKLEGDSKSLENIIIEVQGSTLVIENKKGINFLNNSKTVKISFNAKNLKSIGLSGSGNIQTKGVHKTDKMNVALSGSGNIDVKTSAQKVNVGISGSGNVNLEGSADNVDIAISGSGDVNAFDLNSKNVKVGVSGSGDVRITSTENLTVFSSGSSDLYYKGNPTKINAQSSGSGDIIKAN